MGPLSLFQWFAQNILVPLWTFIYTDNMLSYILAFYVIRKIIDFYKRIRNI